MTRYMEIRIFMEGSQIMNIAFIIKTSNILNIWLNLIDSLSKKKIILFKKNKLLLVNFFLFLSFLFKKKKKKFFK